MFKELAVKHEWVRLIFSQIRYLFVRDMYVTDREKAGQDEAQELKFVEVALRRSGWPGHPSPRRYTQLNKYIQDGEKVPFFVYEAPVASWRVIRARIYHRLCRWLHTPSAYKLFGVR